MDKQFTSNTEDKRLNIEEPELMMGRHILPQQIWRDGALIPGSPDKLEFSIPDVEDGLLVAYSYFKDGMTTHPLVKKIERLPLQKVRGTKDTYFNKDLINLIGREFDSDPNDKAKSWQYTIYSGNTALAYDAGKPIIDIATGVLRFRSEEFVANIEDDEFFISFYKYIGRTGFLGSENNEQDVYGGIDIPFRDDIKHFKDADNDERTATFRLEGEIGNTIYVLPNAAEVYDGANIVVDEYQQTTSINKNLGIVMLQENYQEIDWNIGLHNGGVWFDDGSVRKN